MNIYLVDAGEQDYIDAYEPAPEGYIARWERDDFCLLVAASTRGQAHSIALKHWRRNTGLLLAWISPVSIQKLTCAERKAGIIGHNDPLWEAPIWENTRL